MLRCTAERAQLTADRHDPFTFGIIAGGAITLYLGTGAKLYFVNYAIHSIEFKEAKGGYGPLNPILFSPQKKANARLFPTHLPFASPFASRRPFG